MSKKAIINTEEMPLVKKTRKPRTKPDVVGMFQKLSLEEKHAAITTMKEILAVELAEALEQSKSTFEKMQQMAGV